MNALEYFSQKMDLLTPNDLKSRRYVVSMGMVVTQDDPNKPERIHENSFVFSMNYHDVLLVQTFFLEMLGNLVKLGFGMWQHASSKEAPREGS